MVPNALHSRVPLSTLNSIRRDIDRDHAGGTTAIFRDAEAFDPGLTNAEATEAAARARDHKAKDATTLLPAIAAAEGTPFHRAQTAADGIVNTVRRLERLGAFGDDCAMRFVLRAELSQIESAHERLGHRLDEVIADQKRKADPFTISPETREKIAAEFPSNRYTEFDRDGRDDARDFSEGGGR